MDFDNGRLQRVETTVRIGWRYSEQRGRIAGVDGVCFPMCCGARDDSTMGHEGPTAACSPLSQLMYINPRLVRPTVGLDDRSMRGRRSGSDLGRVNLIPTSGLY